MKKEVSPAVVWAILAVVGVVVVVFGYKMLAGPGDKKETKGSEGDMARVKSGGAMYQPPANAPVPRVNGGGPGGAPGGYNLQPPPR